MCLVVLTEERSMERVLHQVLPKIVPAEIGYRIIPHNGKSDLRKSIPLKLKGWNVPGDVFVIIHDQDSNDCRTIKKELIDITSQFDKKVLIRIACHELESWYWGDLNAVMLAYNKDLTSYANRKGFRDPDSIENAKEEFVKAFPCHQQIKGAERIAQYMSIDGNCSRSFNAFVKGVRDIISV